LQSVLFEPVRYWPSFSHTLEFWACRHVYALWTFLFC